MINREKGNLIQTSAKCLKKVADEIFFITCNGANQLLKPMHSA